MKQQIHDIDRSRLEGKQKHLYLKYVEEICDMKNVKEYVKESMGTNQII